METSDLLVPSIIILAFAVLQIILFFKLWAMTNDVRSLRNKLTTPSASGSAEEIRKLILCGKKEQARDIMICQFAEKINSLGETCSDTSFKSAKSSLEQRLKQIGYELPDTISNLNNGLDYFKIYYYHY